MTVKFIKFPNASSPFETALGFRACWKWVFQCEFQICKNQTLGKAVGTGYKAIYTWHKNLVYHAYSHPLHPVFRNLKDPLTPFSIWINCSLGTALCCLVENAAFEAAIFSVFCVLARHSNTRSQLWGSDLEPAICLNEERFRTPESSKSQGSPGSPCFGFVVPQAQ